MRTISYILAALMALFAVVQFNDPDGLFWMVVYGVPAVLALIAAIRPQAYRANILRAALLLCLLLALVGMVYYWPKTPGWWTQDVWWEVESAREGMGMMITVIVLAIIFWMQHRLRRRV